VHEFLEREIGMKSKHWMLKEIQDYHVEIMVKVNPELWEYIDLIILNLPSSHQRDIDNTSFTDTFLPINIENWGEKKIPYVLLHGIIHATKWHGYGV
jgi:hypothetical protein